MEVEVPHLVEQIGQVRPLPRPRCQIGSDIEIVVLKVFHATQWWIMFINLHAVNHGRGFHCHVAFLASNVLCDPADLQVQMWSLQWDIKMVRYTFIISEFSLFI